MNDRKIPFYCVCPLPRDENKYDLKAYWDATGLSGVEIVAKYERAAHDHLALLYNDAEERGAAQATATRKVRQWLWKSVSFGKSVIRLNSQFVDVEL